jgi:hypothetical protein
LFFFSCFFDQRRRDISDHFLYCSLVVLAVILPTAVEGLFPAIAVALGVSAVLIAKGIFWGAVIGGIIGGGYVQDDPIGCWNACWNVTQAVIRGNAGVYVRDNESGCSIEWSFVIGSFLLQGHIKRKSRWAKQ